MAVVQIGVETVNPGQIAYVNPTKSLTDKYYLDLTFEDSTVRTYGFDTLDEANVIRDELKINMPGNIEVSNYIINPEKVTNISEVSEIDGMFYVDVLLVDNKTVRVVFETDQLANDFIDILDMTISTVIELSENSYQDFYKALVENTFYNQVGKSIIEDRGVGIEKVYFIDWIRGTVNGEGTYDKPIKHIDNFMTLKCNPLIENVLVVQLNHNGLVGMDGDSNNKLFILYDNTFRIQEGRKQVLSTTNFILMNYYGKDTYYTNTTIVTIPPNHNITYINSNYEAVPSHSMAIHRGCNTIFNLVSFNLRGHYYFDNCKLIALDPIQAFASEADNPGTDTSTFQLVNCDVIGTNYPFMNIFGTPSATYTLSRIRIENTSFDDLYTSISRLDGPDLLLKDQTTQDYLMKRGALVI